MTLVNTYRLNEACPIEKTLRCNYCSNEFPDMFPHISFDNDTHIEMECCRKMAEVWMGKPSDFYGLLWLREMELKHYSKFKKKRSCYINKEVRKEILKKYKFTCVTCGAKDNLSIDHIHPVSRGGLNTIDNLQVLCRSCNSRKSNKI